MEKLRKALDRAREERGDSKFWKAEFQGSSGAERPVPATENYSYTQTRVLEPNPEVFERNRVLSPGEMSLAADAFRMLRTQVVQRMGEQGWRTLAVTSPTRNEGRTLAAVNLAIALASDPRYSVLLCDLDLRSPSIADLFGFEPTVGVDDVLSGSASVADVLVHPRGFERLVLLPARTALNGSSEYLSSAATKAMVKELRERYPDRILIFDLPAVLLSDDALAFTPNVECALVVISEGTTRREDVSRCMEMLQNTPVVGTLLNRSLSGKASLV